MNAKPTNASRFPLVAILAGLIVVVALGLRARDAWVARTPVLAELTLRDKTFIVEIADTDAKKERGLGKRDALASDRGMYFPFPSANFWIFWMKDMRFPIDIVWIRDGVVVDIDASVPVPTGEELETYSPIEPADAVLELNAGVAAELGVVSGDSITLKALP
ncbi:MAG: DUF192 domain-containing protein [Patescibacteria group bacterium]|nr:MAG: DUF192 domain-containing protein [Patescibacteria group bacterium]